MRGWKWKNTFSRKASDAFRRDDGQSLVLVGLMSAILLGMAGVGVTIGTVYSAKSVLQNAVDAAALAGAQYVNTNPGGSPGGQNVLIGQNDPGASGEVSFDSKNPEYVDAFGSKVISGGFASVFGFPTFTVTARAVAQRWPGAFNFAVFQGNNSTLYLKGNVNVSTPTGAVGTGDANVFSNGTTNVDGASVNVTGEIGAVGSVTYKEEPLCSSSITTQCLMPNQQPIPMPNLSVTSGSVCYESTYYSSLPSLPLTCNSTTTKTVVIDTSTTIKLTTSVPYAIVVYGGGSIDIEGNGTVSGTLAVFGTGSITVGGGVTVNGIVYAPQGTINLGGSAGGGGGTATVNGEVVGGTDSLSGDFTVNYTPGAAQNSPFNQVVLVQ